MGRRKNLYIQEHILACKEAEREYRVSDHALAVLMKQGFLLNLGCQFLGWAVRQHIPDSTAAFWGHFVSWGLRSILCSSWLYNKHYWPLSNLSSPNTGLLFFSTTVYTKLAHLRRRDLLSPPSISPMRYWNYRFACCLAFHMVSGNSNSGLTLLMLKELFPWVISLAPENWLCSDIR